jgi:hypothetical protein
MERLQAVEVFQDALQLSVDADARQAALEKIILNPKYHDILTLVKGVRNGIVYGTKVRFPHALVYAVMNNQRHTQSRR